jgi:hypothetical protein
VKRYDSGGYPYVEIIFTDGSKFKVIAESQTGSIGYEFTEEGAPA